MANIINISQGNGNSSPVTKVAKDIIAQPNLEASPIDVAEKAKRLASSINKRLSQPQPQDSENAIQQLFSKSRLTNKDIHIFRNSRHNEFLEKNPFAVRLRSLANGDTVAFRVSPEIVESRNVAYKTLDPLHMPGAIPIFQNSPPRTWNISGTKLISRNGVEAEENLSIVNQLRAWQVPFFGNSRTSGKDNFTAEMFGAPPEVLHFTAYSKPSEDSVTNIRQIPVVLTTLTIQYSNDVDYIKTEQTSQPFPAIISVDMSLLEVHSPREYSNFNILDYKNGKLKGF